MTGEKPKKRVGVPRHALTYRGARRNLHFGRKSKGNTKPHERYEIWELKRKLGVK